MAEKMESSEEYEKMLKARPLIINPDGSKTSICDGVSYYDYPDFTDNNLLRWKKIQSGHDAFGSQLYENRSSVSATEAPHGTTTSEQLPKEYHPDILPMDD